jgi:hypothetical protein
MEDKDAPVSHADLYHKLGRLEALMETMMSSVSSFQSAIKDLHSRIDSLENRQLILEKRRSTDSGAVGALVSLGKDFAIPLLAIAVAWLVAREGLIGNRFRPNTDNYYQKELPSPRSDKSAINEHYINANLHVRR